MVDSDLFVVVAALLEPVVGWFPRNGRWLPLVTAANNLNASLVKPVEEGLEHGPGDRADLVPDDHPGDVLLTHAVRRPLSLARPPEEAVVRLCVDAPGPHLLGQAMGWGEDERLPPAEQLNGSRGLAGTSAAIEVAQSMPGERVSVGRCGAVRDVVASAPVLGFGLVGGVVLRAKDSLAFVSPLGWSDEGKSLFSKEAVQTCFVSTVAKHRGDVCLNAVELVEGCLFHVYAVCGHADSLVGREASKHLEKVNVRIRQHTSPEMGKLGLAAVIVGEDPTSWAPFGGTYQGPALPAVTNEEVELALVCDKPACKPLAVGFGALCKLSDDRARLVPRVREPHLRLLLEGNDGLGNLELSQEARLDHVGKKSRGHPLLFLEVRAEPRCHNRVKAGGKLPAADLGEAGADVVDRIAIKWAVDGNAGHAVSWVAEALKPWRGLSLALKARRVAGLHVDANHFVDVEVGGVPETAVAVFHARSFHQVDGRGLPDVFFAGDDARGVVFPKDLLGQGFGILWC